MSVRLLAISAFTLCLSPAVASQLDDANRATAFMAAASVCKAEISQEKRREMYAAVLRVYNTPSSVNYFIAKEADALKGMQPLERDAMCSALNDQIKNTTH